MADIQKQISSSPGENTPPTKPEAHIRIQGPNDKLNPLNFRGTPTSYDREPTRNPLDEDGAKRPQKGVGRTSGRLTPFWAQSGPTFSCSPLAHPLRRSRTVPPRKLRRRSTLRGLYKEEESPPLTTRPSCRSCASLQRRGAA